MLHMQILFLCLHCAVNYMAQMFYFILLVFFTQQGFSVALLPPLQIALVDQAGFRFIEICLPLPLEYLD